VRRPEPPGFAAEAIRGRLSLAQLQELALVARDARIVDSSLLWQELSLHLPRFARDEAYSPEIVLAEARRLASRLSSLQSPHLSCVPVVEESTKSADLVFSKLSAEIARPIHEAFHYLLSFRGKGDHFGLWSGSSRGWPIAMCSVCPFDLLNMEAALVSRGFAADSAVVIARVYAFPSAPKNSLTFLFGNIRRWLRNHHPTAQVLLTYVNPNIGFTGLSYRADNWSLLGWEPTQYSYVEGSYITERELARLQLQGKFSVAQSKCELQPLRVLMRPVRRPDSSAAKGVRFPPWSPPTVSEVGR